MRLLLLLLLLLLVLTRAEDATSQELVPRIPSEGFWEKLCELDESDCFFPSNTLTDCDGQGVALHTRNDGEE